MKNGDVSLILKNVTTNDNGTYKCEVQYKGSREITPISSIHLYVRLQGESVCLCITAFSSFLVVNDRESDQITAHSSFSAGDEDTGRNDGGNKDTSIGLIVGLIILGLLVAAGVLFLIYRNKPVCLKKKNPDHPAAV